MLLFFVFLIPSNEIYISLYHQKLFLVILYRITVSCTCFLGLISPTPKLSKSLDFSHMPISHGLFSPANTTHIYACSIHNHILFCSFHPHQNCPILLTFPTRQSSHELFPCWAHTHLCVLNPQPHSICLTIFPSTQETTETSSCPVSAVQSPQYIM